MSTKLYVLNLSKLGGSPRRIEVVENLFGYDVGQAEISEIAQIDHPGPIILYIVGHALPDTLLVQGRQGIKAITEDDFIGDLRSILRDRKALLIFDLCYAQSFQDVCSEVFDNGNTVVIFSCQSYEQAWHTGPSTKDRPRQTLCSIALNDAIGSVTSWKELQPALNARLNPLQHPSIPIQPLAPADFDLPTPQPTRAAS